MDKLKPAQLPFLLKLLDDESPAIREQITQELLAFGDSLESEIAAAGIEPDGDLRELLTELARRRDREHFKQAWGEVLETTEGKLRLELTLNLIGRYQLGADARSSLSDLLDRLGQEYRESHIGSDPFTLSHFLFRTKGLGGCSREDYYRPGNSNLIQVIASGQGLPISLACIYILLGHRLGLDIEGCNAPHHFLARAVSAGRVVLVDCFNGGHIVEVEKISGLAESPAQLAAVRRGADIGTIIQRVLANLANAYARAGDDENAELFKELRGAPQAR